jgi:hypothetical protein
MKKKIIKKSKNKIYEEEIEPETQNKILTINEKKSNIIQALNNFATKEIKVRCLNEHKDENEDETISYEYLFMSILEDNEDPTTKDFIELKIKTNSPKYEIQKYYYFTMMTKLRD